MGGWSQEGGCEAPAMCPPSFPAAFGDAGSSAGHPQPWPGHVPGGVIQPQRVSYGIARGCLALAGTTLLLQGACVVRLSPPRWQQH